MARRLAVAVTVLVTVLVSVVYVTTGSVELRTALSQATIVALPVLLLVTALAAPRGHRPPLFVVLAASIVYVLAEGVAVSRTVDGKTPYPNPGEALVSLGAVLMLVALVLILGRRPRRGRAERLDVGIAAVGVVLLFAQTGLISFAGSGGASVAVAGPLVLFAVAYLGIALLTIGQPNGARPGTSMLVGAVSMVLADVGFLMSTLDGVDEDGRLTDVGYIVTRGAFVVMALQLGQVRTDGYRAVERYRVSVAGAVALLTPLGAVIGARTHPDGPEWLTVLALVLPVSLLTTRAVLTVGRLTEEAGLDPLTGLHSRRSVLESLDRLCSHGPAFTLVVCDLDGFKAVNDRHGHAAGDAVLREVADLLRRSAPPGSTVGRLGGDEFAVLVEGTTGPEAVRTALSSTLAHHLAGLTGHGAGVGISIGTTVGRVGSDPHDLLVRADGAMYAVKHSAGRGSPRARVPGQAHGQVVPHGGAGAEVMGGR